MRAALQVKTFHCIICMCKFPLYNVRCTNEISCLHVAAERWVLPFGEAPPSWKRAHVTHIRILNGQAD